MSNRRGSLIKASAMLCLLALIAFSGFTQHTKLSLSSIRRFLEEEDGSPSTLSETFIRFSSNTQLWLIMHPNIPFSSILLTILYSIDVILIVDAGNLDGPKNFLSTRQEILGKNFAALGSVIVTNYTETAALIETPQKKGCLLGGLRLNPNLMPEKFLLFLSDEEAGGTGLHSQLHNLVWETVVLPGLNRAIEDESGDFASYLSEGKENIKNLAGTDKTAEIFKMNVRYVWHALLGEAIDDDTELLVFNRFKGDTSTILTDHRIIGAIMPFSLLLRPFQKPADEAKEILVKKILDSPYMETYEPSSEYGNLSNEEWAELLLSLVGIAGVTTNSVIMDNIEQYASVADGINTTSEEDLTLAVLEAARIRAPANNVMIITQEEKTFVVNGETVTLPVDTVLANSVGAAGWDEDEFPDPHTFDHTRANLVNSTLNFNYVGWDPDTLGKRTCPGLVIAMKMGIDWLAVLKEE